MTFQRQLTKIFLKFLRMVGLRMGYTYAEVMTSLDLTSSSNRRKQHDIMFLYSLTNHHYDCPFLLSSINFNVSSVMTRHRNNFSVCFHGTNYIYNSPLSRMMCTTNEFDIDFFSVNKFQFDRMIKSLISDYNLV